MYSPASQALTVEWWYARELEWVGPYSEVHVRRDERHGTGRQSSVVVGAAGVVEEAEGVALER